MQRKIIHPLVKFIILYSVCAFRSTEGLVGPGVREAEEGEFPHVVCLVRFSSQPSFIRNDIKCTGILITRDHVLTAEHCLDNMGFRSLYVLQGSRDLRLATNYYIYWWLSHDQWAYAQNRRLEWTLNDIVLIKLLEKVPETVLPALVSFDEHTSLFGAEVVLVGWGKLENDVNPFILHTGKATIISNSDCSDVAYRINGDRLLIHDRFLCSIGEPPTVLHHGDSGGPVLLGSFVLGVNRGSCPRTDRQLILRKANIHVGVDYYRLYINDVMRI